MFVRDGGRERNHPHGVKVDRLAEVIGTSPLPLGERRLALRNSSRAGRGALGDDAHHRSHPSPGRRRRKAGTPLRRPHRLVVRRIDQERRPVYTVKDDDLVIVQARYHY
jgi:hypothetical protein